MSSSQVIDAVGALHAAFDALADLPFDTLSHSELLRVLDDMETLARKAPAIEHRIIARLQREASPKELGAKTLKTVLRQRLRISGKDATRRLAEASDLGPRVSFTGETMPPVRAAVATAQVAGTIGSEHVEVIRGFFEKLPVWVDPETLELSEQTLVGLAAEFCPEELGKAADRLAALIDQDGTEPNDAERARRRSVRISPQQADGMSKLTGNMTPELRAVLEPLMAKLTAPGMCNPADEYPCISGTPSQEQIDDDDRSYGQRVHDALIVIGRIVLMSGELGQLNGLPVTIIVSTTLQDLQTAAVSGGATPVTGSRPAVTGGGSLLPMTDLIRMAAHAHHYLAVFDKHTNQALYLGRTRRLASPGQRIMLHARDRGCTFPGCTVSGYGSQVHHTTGWAKHDGQTNIGELTLACGGDNRLAEEGWNVTIRNGVAEWQPPPRLDTGQARVNFYHHPERLLIDDDGGAGHPDVDDHPDEPELGIGA